MITDVDKLEKELATQPAAKSEFCAGKLSELRFHLHVQAPNMIAEIRRYRVMIVRVRELALSLEHNHKPEMRAVGADLRSRQKETE